MMLLANIVPLICLWYHHGTRCDFSFGVHQEPDVTSPFFLHTVQGVLGACLVPLAEATCIVGNHSKRVTLEYLVLEAGLHLWLQGRRVNRLSIMSK